MENKTDFFSSHLEFTNLKCYEGGRLSFKNMCKIELSNYLRRMTRNQSDKELWGKNLLSKENSRK